jgi:nucleotide-binding universal stress UspA family protein
MAASALPVVAGVDGSQYAVTAAQWAAAEAGRRRVPLRLVAINDDPARAEYVDKALQDATELCRARTESEVTAEVIHGHPIEELLRCGEHARLVVLGNRGQGRFAGALLGSVSGTVATQAACPVVVIRGTPATTGPVVVGVDGSPASLQALRCGFEAAALRGTEVVAVQAWHEEGLLSVPLVPEDREKVQREIAQSLTEQVAGCREKYPSVAARTIAQHGHPVVTLKDAARDAQLLVVGHRGRGGFDGLFLGSVAAGVLHHALCPVMVIRAGVR